MRDPERAGEVGASTRDWLPALTGVRGLAVGLVLAFHSGLPIPSGGLGGVTLFFVLSGYLITTLLVRECEATGSVDLRQFFLRRARRLLPALIMVVAIVTAIGVVAGSAPAAIEDALLSISYLANWARAEGDPMGLLNHIWSLGIEAQFYVVWPLAFVVLARKGPMNRWRLGLLLAALAVGSTVLRSMLVAGGADDARIYFGTDTRADALLAGCTLALLRGRPEPVVGFRGIGPLAVVSFLAVCVMPTLHPLWPDSAYTFATIASVAIVIAALQPDPRLTGLTAWPLRWLGERSYSLYLVHVPVLMVVGTFLTSIEATARGTLAVGISIMLSMALYRFVEMPFRQRRTAARARVPRRIGLHLPRRMLREPQREGAAS